MIKKVNSVNQNFKSTKWQILTTVSINPMYHQFDEKEKQINLKKRRRSWI